MDFYITRHAEEQCERRGISSEILDAVLQNPQQIIDDTEGKRIYQSQVYCPNTLVKTTHFSGRL